MVLKAAVYQGLAAYLDIILPGGEHAPTPLPWYFPILPSYWLPDKVLTKVLEITLSPHGYLFKATTSNTDTGIHDELFLPFLTHSGPPLSHSHMT